MNRSKVDKIDVLGILLAITGALLTYNGMVLAEASRPSVYVVNSPYDKCLVYGVEGKIVNLRPTPVLNPDLVVLTPSEIDLSASAALGTLNVSTPKRLQTRDSSVSYLISCRGKLCGAEQIIIRFCSAQKVDVTVFIAGDNYSDRKALSLDPLYNFSERLSQILDWLTPLIAGIFVSIVVWFAMQILRVETR